MKASIVTLVATAALAAGSQAAQAHLLSGDNAVVSSKAAASKTALSVMTRAGIRYHAAANYQNEQRLSSTSSALASGGVRPDDRAGIRGA